MRAAIADNDDDADDDVSRTRNVYGDNKGVNDASLYTVTVDYLGERVRVPCAAGQSILDAVEQAAHWDEVPCSCRAGVCTTCAARLLAGSVDAPFAALNESVTDQGFILTCSSTPTTANVHVQLGAFDDTYERQYGQYEVDARAS